MSDTTTKPESVDAEIEKDLADTAQEIVSGLSQSSNASKAIEAYNELIKIIMAKDFNAWLDWNSKYPFWAALAYVTSSVFMLQVFGYAYWRTNATLYKKQYTEVKEEYENYKRVYDFEENKRLNQRSLNLGQWEQGLDYNSRRGS
jgi:hypothetical protein